MVLCHGVVLVLLEYTLRGIIVSNRSISNCLPSLSYDTDLCHSFGKVTGSLKEYSIILDSIHLSYTMVIYASDTFLKTPLA